jgi:hypothetical protein
MKLWKISQEKNGGYDTYSDAVVAAETEEEARVIQPDGNPMPKNWGSGSDWAPPEFVAVQYLGEASSDISSGVICASFHAG